VSATAPRDRELLLVQSSIVDAVVSWTNAKFPFRTDEQWGFYLLRRPVVTVIGKAFYDIDHSGKNPRRNRRNYDSSLAVWEIHPVMKLVQNGP
jgi:hypothetical protein